ncbi:MAG: hypothetical protein NVS3B28_30520 [Candidatus Velthaea sp.]
MAPTHRIKFEPVDIEMEIDESETVLDAAFRQGITLMHGCKEGQCAACKSFVIDGEIDLDKYSNFALNDSEREEGFTLLCRTHVYSDTTIELVNYDEEMLRSSTPIQAFRTEVAVVEKLTHDIRRLELKLLEPATMKFAAGQYVDVTIPGTSEKRAFSMANIPGEEAVVEFIIKLYPGGHFSGLLDGSLKPGDALDIKGPYGTCTLRASSERDLILVGGGAGMAPLWSLINVVAESGSARKVTFYYGARTHVIYSILRNYARSKSACRTSATSSRFPSRRRTTDGRAKQVSSATFSSGVKAILAIGMRTSADRRRWSMPRLRRSNAETFLPTASTSISLPSPRAP